MFEDRSMVFQCHCTFGMLVCAHRTLRSLARGHKSGKVWKKRANPKWRSLRARTVVGSSIPGSRTSSSCGVEAWDDNTAVCENMRLSTCFNLPFLALQAACSTLIMRPTRLDPLGLCFPHVIKIAYASEFRSCPILPIFFCTTVKKLE